MALKQKIGQFLGAVGILFFIAIVIYFAFFRVGNEIGPIGADKAGRQIFLQSLQYYWGSPLSVTVTSEWSSSTFLERLLIQEPMRTTIRLVVPDSMPQPSVDAPSEILNPSFRDFFSQFKPATDANISLRENDFISLQDFYRGLDSLGVKSFGDMLAAMGFRHFEIIHGKRLVAKRNLPTIGRGNVLWAGIL